MASIVARLRIRRLLLSRVWLLTLIVWFAIPEAKSYKATGKLQFHPHLVKPSLAQAGYAKHEQANAVAKQLLIIPCIREYTVWQHVPKLLHTHIAQSSSYYNSFYVYTTIKAP